MKAVYRILLFTLLISGVCIQICRGKGSNRPTGKFISTAEANDFLRYRRSLSPQECRKKITEDLHKESCKPEDWRVLVRYDCCAGCPTGTTPRPTVDSRCTYKCDCIEKNECESHPCQNGGVCTDGHNSFTCTCKAGYTGKRCETNINECASSPCKNRATCEDRVNEYKCHCSAGFYGVHCEADVCHPTPADVVFLLDSSISMTEKQFKKQLDFIANFSDRVAIGKNDFQISVITFSFNAKIEFYLNNYTSNITLKEAVARIKFRPGSTFTDKALEQLPDVFKKENGGERLINGTLPGRFVFLMTDGMATDKRRTVNIAKEMIHRYKFQLSALGIGNEVCHQELLDIASDSSLVYSVQDFDSLYTVLKSLVYHTCGECWTSFAADVAIVVDTSNTMAEEHFHDCLSAVSNLIDQIDLHVNKTRISITTFGSNVEPVFGFNEHFNKDDVQSKINMNIRRPDRNPDNKANITKVFNYLELDAFKEARNLSKKLAMVFTNGRFQINNHHEMNKLKGVLLNKNITTVYIGSGPGADIDTLLELTNDEYDVYVEASDDMTYLKVLKSYLTYNVCELKDKRRKD